MSLYQPGLTLKALLENPELLAMPPNDGKINNYAGSLFCSDFKILIGLLDPAFFYRMEYYYISNVRAPTAMFPLVANINSLFCVCPKKIDGQQ